MGREDLKNTVIVKIMKKRSCMKKVKIMVVSVLCCAIGFVGFIAYEKATMSEVEKFMQANIEALASVETKGGSGLLWEKEWWDCVTGDYIYILSTGGEFQAGAVYKFTATLEGRVIASGVSYRIVPGGQPGQKSYCKDGWNFCSENECR